MRIKVIKLDEIKRFFKKSKNFSCEYCNFCVLYRLSKRRGGRVADCAGLLNRCRALNPYREFESHPLRFEKLSLMRERWGFFICRYYVLIKDL